MQVVEQQQHRHGALALEEAQHRIEAGGSRVGSGHNHVSVGLERAATVKVIKRLAEDAEGQRCFGGVPAAGADHHPGSGQRAGAIEHRRLPQSGLTDQKQGPAAPCTGVS